MNRLVSIPIHYEKWRQFSIYFHLVFFLHAHGDLLTSPDSKNHLLCCMAIPRILSYAFLKSTNTCYWQVAKYFYGIPTSFQISAYDSWMFGCRPALPEIALVMPQYFRKDLICRVQENCFCSYGNRYIPLFTRGYNYGVASLQFSGIFSLFQISWHIL